MTPPFIPIVFLCDEDVPVSVSSFLRDRGHTIHTVKGATFEGEPDEVIARLGHELSREIESDVIVVTSNHKHFIKLIARRPPNNNLRFRHLGRLSMRCPRPMAIKRLTETIEDIEREYQLCQSRPDRRLIMDIDEHHFSIER